MVRVSMALWFRFVVNCSSNGSSPVTSLPFGLYKGNRLIGAKLRWASRRPVRLSCWPSGSSLPFDPCTGCKGADLFNIKRRDLCCDYVSEYFCCIHPDPSFFSVSRLAHYLVPIYQVPVSPVQIPALDTGKQFYRRVSLSVMTLDLITQRARLG